MILPSVFVRGAMWHDLLTAVALVLVIEGILPFLNPAGFRKTMAMIAQLEDKVLRGIGIASMAAGVILLYIVR